MLSVKAARDYFRKSASELTLYESVVLAAAIKRPGWNWDQDRDAAFERARLILAPMRRLAHRLRRNTRAGSRKNIAAHYDLGNDFYRLFLDETMTYSAAVFETPKRDRHATRRPVLVEDDEDDEDEGRVSIGYAVF